MANWQLYLCGGFRLERDGVRVTFSTRKVESLLAYLTLYPDAHPREKIGALFWGDSSDEAAMRSLRVALTELRKVLGKDALLSDRATMQLNSAFPLWVDAREMYDSRFFISDLNSADSAQLANLNATALVAKIEKYKGELLAGYFDEWLDAPRQRLAARYVELLHALIEQDRTRGDYDSAMALAQRALAHDAADETAHQHLMFCYHAVGDRAAALQQYERCKRALRDELGVGPSDETNALYTLLREKTTGGSRAARLTNLPRPLTNFIGRTREVGELTRWLGDEQHALVTLLGPGGSGKTRLAIETATRVIPKFSDGVWWVDLAALTDAALVVPTMGQVLGVTERGGEELLSTVREAVREKQMLVVLDNCEHVLAECARVADALLPHTDGLQILTTSREALGIAGELTYPVPPLAVPQANTQNVTELLLSFEGVRLFVERARMVKPDFELSDENALAVTQICMQLDGIPLALELAAARLNVLSAEQIALRLHDRFRLLTNQQRMVLPRQQTLRALIDWSYDLLSDAERRAFRRLAIFAGGWTLDAAEEIIADELLPRAEVLELLASLIRKSLIVVDDSAGGIRYRFLETIHAYAREKLVANVGEGLDEAEHRALARCHLVYFTDFAARLDSELFGRNELEWLARGDGEQDNLRAALTWADAQDRAFRRTELSVLCAALQVFWLRRGQFQEGEKWLNAALDETKGQNDLLRARVLTGLGSMVWGKGEHIQAERLHTQALDLYRALDDPDGIVRSLTYIMSQAIWYGELERAHSLYAQAKPLVARVQRSHLVTGLEINHCVTALYENNLERAQQWGEQALRLARNQGDIVNVANSLHNLGHISYARQEYAQAQTRLDEAETFMEQIGDPRMLAENALVRALVLEALYEYGDALLEARRCFDLSRRLANRVKLAHSIELCALILLERSADSNGAADTLPQVAVLLGAAQGMRGPHHAPPLIDAPELYENSLRTLRRQLGDELLSQTMAQGQTLTLSEITNLIRQIPI